VGRDGIVCVASCCGLDSLWIESQWGRDFLHLSRLAFGYDGCQVSCLGVKELGHGIAYKFSPSDKVKGRVELYLCSPSDASWQVTGRTLPSREHNVLPLVRQFGDCYVGKSLLSIMRICEAWKYKFTLENFQRNSFYIFKQQGDLLYF
jgi:hypothetical protein